ncbi:MAG: DNA mismatch repair endonuclease MutL [bacterium]|nr:DNA mismatch repair endonuclease MutL [bacterium]
MASRIKLLPNVLINKIAAGEVIERPASVVKELVENSLDAQATSVRIDIADGGLGRIEVNDNGIGMTPEDLKLAICRHATSKLSSPDDLFAISSFGFRGEALPSILSVSQSTIKSRARGADSGYQLEIAGGELTSESEVGCDFGTTISVRNIFFNTPARRKFLKSPSAEVRRLIEVVESLAISNPQCEFILDSDGQRLVDLAASTDKFDRAKQLFGSVNSEKFVRGERNGDSLRVEVFVSKPEACRRNRSRILLLVNGRRIESRSLFAAVTSAYGEFLAGGLYPQGAIFITIDPSLVDVNVHPAKSEVRFADERVIFHTIYHVVRESLLEGRVVPGLNAGSSPGRREDFSGYAREVDARRAVQSFFEPRSLNPVQAEESMAAIFAQAATTPETHQHSFSAATETAHAQTTESVQPTTARHELSTALRGEVRLQQLALLYIVAVTADSILIIDQHAAHERILYELALKSFGHHTISSQRLLLPMQVHLEPDDLFTYEKEKESLAALGFVVESFGPRQIQIEAVPAVLGRKNPEVVFRELLDDFSDVKGDEQKRFQKKAASFACRGAIMSGDRLSEPAMRALFENLMTSENPYVCPHGRPTMIRFSKHELDVKFGRIG